MTKPNLEKKTQLLPFRETVFIIIVTIQTIFQNNLSAFANPNPQTQNLSLQEIEKCDAPTKNLEGLAINRVLREIWNLEQTTEGQKILKERIVDLGGNIQVYQKPECSNDLSQKLVESVQNNPYIQWVIQNNYFTEQNFPIIIFSGHNNGISVVNVNNDNGMIGISVNVGKMLEFGLINQMINELWEIKVQLTMQQAKIPDEARKKFFNQIQIYTWAITAITDMRIQIANKPVPQNIYQKLIVKFGQNQVEQMNSQLFLSLFQKEINQMNTNELVDYFNKMLEFVISTGAYKNSNQQFEGSFDYRETQEFIKQFNSIISLLPGLNFSKIELVISQRKIDSKTFYKPVFGVKNSVFQGLAQ